MTHEKKGDGPHSLSPFWVRIDNHRARPNNGLQPTRVPLRSTRAAETWRWVASSLLSCGCHSMELMLSSRHDRLLQE